jgi:hypothetical protein
LQPDLVDHRAQHRVGGAEIRDGLLGRCLFTAGRGTPQAQTRSSEVFISGSTTIAPFTI